MKTITSAHLPVNLTEDVIEKDKENDDDDKDDLIDYLKVSHKDIFEACDEQFEMIVAARATKITQCQRMQAIIRQESPNQIKLRRFTIVYVVLEAMLGFYLLLC